MNVFITVEKMHIISWVLRIHVRKAPLSQAAREEKDVKRYTNQEKVRRGADFENIVLEYC